MGLDQQIEPSLKLVELVLAVGHLSLKYRNLEFELGDPLGETLERYLRRGCRPEVAQAGPDAAAIGKC